MAHEAFGELLPSEAPVAGELSIHRMEDTIVVTASIEARLYPECDRCLKPYDEDFSIQVRQFLMPAEAEGVPGDVETELEAEDLEFGSYSGQTLQLEQILGEQIVLALPIQSLCREDCRGLCEHCGINLNEDSCICHREHAASPFAALKTLKI